MHTIRNFPTTCRTYRTYLPLLARKHKLVNYFRYVDDILLIYDSHYTNIHAMLDGFSSMHQNLQFTEEVEKDNKLNHLDTRITIYKTPTNLKIFIYRKPTFIDTLIPYTSNHPITHKYAAIRYLHNRLKSKLLSSTQRRIPAWRKHHSKHPL
jgi:hypothetical protein